MNIDEVVDNFSHLEDWEDRYRYLIDLGDELQPLPESGKTDENKVRGCMSQVWVVLGWDAQGRLEVEAESDARIVQGLLAIICAAFRGKTAEEIRRTDIAGIFRKMELDQHLSPNRRNGFFAVVERIRAFTA